MRRGLPGHVIIWRNSDCAAVILQKTSPRKVQLSPFTTQSGAPSAGGGSAWRALALLAAAQLILLIGFSLLGHHAPPLDVTEMHSWAFAPQPGYFKHPPLPAWGVAVSEALFGRSQFALFVPAAVSVVVATLAIWPLALRIAGPRRALVALFLQSTVAYYTVYAPDYNHNVAQMPFWALAISAAYFALRDGRARWWFAFGAALGVTALGKYSAIFLLPGLVALLLWERGARRHLTAANLLTALAGLVLAFGPHAAWLVAHDFAPLRYIAERGDDLSATASWFERFGSYVLAQLIANLVPLAVWLLLRRRAVVGTDSGADASARFDRRFVLALGLGPFAATLAVGLAGAYLHPMWASAMFPLSGLLVVLALGARTDRLATRGWLLGWGALMLLYGSAYAVKNTPWWPAMTRHYARAAYPGPELARQLDALWRAEVPGRPLRTIVGTPWESEVASFFSQYRTAVLANADFARTPWVTPDEISRCGAVVVWDPPTGFEAVLRARFPAVKIMPLLLVDPDRPRTYYRKGVAAAVIFPQSGAPATDCPARAL